MLKLFSYSNVNRFLKAEFEQRTIHNARYSLRAFSRDTGVSASRLSEIISKNGVIKLTTADKIANCLKMSSTEKEYFKLLVVSQHGRNVETRKHARGVLNLIRGKQKYFSVKGGYAGLLSKWYYLPLIEFLTLKDSPSLLVLAKTLDISTDEVVKSVSYLTKMGHISKCSKNQWKKSIPFLKIESPAPSGAIKDFHQEFLKKAGNALMHQSIEKRKYLTTVFGIKKEKIEEARKKLEIFNQNFIENYAATEAAEGVYCFSLQLYQLENESIK